MVCSTSPPVTNILVVSMFGCFIVQIILQKSILSYKYIFIEQIEMLGQLSCPFKYISFISPIGLQMLFITLIHFLIMYESKYTFIFLIPFNYCTIIWEMQAIPQIKMRSHTRARTLSLLPYLSFSHRHKQCLTDCFTHGHPLEFADLVNGEWKPWGNERGWWVLLDT